MNEPALATVTLFKMIEEGLEIQRGGARHSPSIGLAGHDCPVLGPLPEPGDRFLPDHRERLRGPQFVHDVLGAELLPLRECGIEGGHDGLLDLGPAEPLGSRRQRIKVEARGVPLPFAQVNRENRFPILQALRLFSPPI